MNDNFNKNFLMDLCKAVIPKTWNVYEYCDIGKRKQGKGILNIELLRYDTESCFEKNNPCQLLQASGTSEHIMYIGGNGHTKLAIHSMREDEEPFILLHELAHIAVTRLASYTTKAYKDNPGFAHSKIIENDMHGEIFHRMLKLFKDRAIKNGYPMFSDFEINKDGHFIYKDEFEGFEVEY